MRIQTKPGMPFQRAIIARALSPCSSSPMIGRPAAASLVFCPGQCWSKQPRRNKSAPASSHERKLSVSRVPAGARSRPTPPGFRRSGQVTLASHIVPRRGHVPGRDRRRGISPFIADIRRHPRRSDDPKASTRMTACPPRVGLLSLATLLPPRRTIRSMSVKSSDRTSGALARAGNRPVTPISRRLMAGTALRQENLLPRPS